jgi:hypothetical protein
VGFQRVEEQAFPRPVDRHTRHDGSTARSHVLGRDTQVRTRSVILPNVALNRPALQGCAVGHGARPRRATASRFSPGLRAIRLRWLVLVVHHQHGDATSLKNAVADAPQEQ